ncbi:MAG: ABC transporter permease [Clostridiaceae bacterium]|nr:ABC transporter permease [Clostridiaceae bacterium]
MLRRLLVYYWRESCNIKTAVFLLVVILLTFFGRSLIWYNDDGEAKLFQPLAISIVDLDESIISYVIRTQMSELEMIENVYLDDMETAQKRLAANQVLMVIELPEGFYEQAVSQDHRDSIKIWLNEQMPAESNLLARMLNHAADSISSIQATLHAYQEELRVVIDDDQQFQKYSEAATLDVAFKLIKRGSMLVIEQEAHMHQVWFVSAALLSLFSMLPALLVLMLVQQEVSSGQHARLQVANVAWWKLHLAKIIIGLIWLITGLIPMAFISQEFMPQLNMWLVLASLIPLYLTTSLLCITLAYRSSRTESILLTAWMLQLAFLLFGGAIYPRQLLPDWMITLQPLSPAYWSFTIIYEALYERVVPISAYLWPLVLSAVGAVLSWLSWRRSSV